MQPAGRRARGYSPPTKLYPSPKAMHWAPIAVNEPSVATESLPRRRASGGALRRIELPTIWAPMMPVFYVRCRGLGGIHKFKGHMTPESRY